MKKRDSGVSRRAHAKQRLRGAYVLASGVPGLGKGISRLAPHVRHAFIVMSLRRESMIEARRRRQSVAVLELDIAEFRRKTLQGLSRVPSNDDGSHD
jgi:hypothetical protein